MQFFYRCVSAALLAALVSGCSGIGRGQRQDIVRWETEARNLGHPEVRYEEYLDPAKATSLGFLPGGGFYVRPGLGVSSLIWPICILWVPGKAHALAEASNYMEFRERILALRQESQPKVVAPTKMHKLPADPKQATAQLRRLEKLWSAGSISETEYLQQRQTIMASMTDEQWDQAVMHPAE